MFVENRKVGSDETCGDVNVLEFSVGEREGERGSGRGVGAVTVFDDALEENFNFSDDF